MSCDKINLGDRKENNSFIKSGDLSLTYFQYLFIKHNWN